MMWNWSGVMHYKDALILMERNEVTQCGLQMENWNEWKWKMDALEWSGN